MDILFIINSILLGVGLAMDAFSVSLANGLNEPEMSKGKELGIGFCFGAFQYAMPIIGWIFVHYLLEIFTSFQKFIPYIALVLLAYIGGKMLLEALKNVDDDDSNDVDTSLGWFGLIVQGIATSIDALSVGFTTSDLSFILANTESIIIGITTFIISLIGIAIGKKFGMKLSKKASILGGVILIIIGLEIFIKGVIL